MLKRIIAGFMVGTMLLTGLPIHAMAAEDIVTVGETAVSTVLAEPMYSGTDIVPNDATGIPDAALYAALKKELDNYGDRDKSMSVERLEMLTSLAVYDTSVKIESLKGLEYCKNLETLKVPYHAISDVSPLEDLTALKVVDLQGNQISDVSALKNLTAMEELMLGQNKLTNAKGLENMTFLRLLYLNDNQLEDVSALSGMSALETLWLYENKLSNISGLSGVTSLTSLSISGNNLSDISALAGLTQMKDLNLTENNISDISPLQGMTGMETLELESNQITNMQPLSNMTNLYGLNLNNNKLTTTAGIPNSDNLVDIRLENNQITDISGLTAAKNVLSLYLDNNAISDITPLRSLTCLFAIDIAGNKISDVSPLVNLPELTYLDLKDNKISKISAMSSMTQLDTLNLSKNQISDMSGLGGLTNIHYLEISENPLSDISPVSGMTGLINLIAENNKISNLEPLRNLIQLENLHLNHNQIVNVSPLSGLINLSRLSLGYNQIVDPSPLKSLDPTCEVDLSYNQITDASSLPFIYLNLEGNPCVTPAPTADPSVTEAPTPTNGPTPTFTPLPTSEPVPTTTPSPTDIRMAELFKRLDEAIAKREKESYLRVDVSDLEIPMTEWEEMEDVFYEAIQDNNKDYFFIFSVITNKNLQTNCLDSFTIGVYDEYKEGDYINWEKIDYQKAKFAYEIKNALSLIREDMSIAEKALVLYNYQQLNCRIAADCSDKDENSGAHTSLLKSIGKPYNYADSMRLLLEAAGIEVRCYGMACGGTIGWNLVRLEDGKWYRLDAYTDDGRIEIETKQHDDGAVAYDNFLMSGDIYWSCFDSWDESSPLAEDDSTFFGYAFDGLRSCLNPCGSDWYYLETEGNTSYIVKTAFNGSNKQRIALNEKVGYLFSHQDKLYYNTTDKVYQYDPVTGAKKVFYDITQEYPGYIIAEFGVKHSSQAFLDLYNSATGDHKELYLPFQTILPDELFVSATKIRLWRIGETQALSTWSVPTYADNAAGIVWSSADPSIVTVDQNGLVTAAGMGTATVTARTADGRLKASCQVVVEDAGQTVVDILFDEYIMSYMEEKVNLASSTYVSFADDCASYVIFESSDPSVVRINEFSEAVAVSYGTVTITATAADGTADSCTIIVHPRGIDHFHLDCTTLYLGSSGVTHQLVADPGQVGFEYSNRDFTWSSSDTSVATVNEDGLVTAVSAGECTITVKAKEWDRYASCKVIVESGGVVPDNSRELVEAFVERMYTVALERASDAGGVTWWTDQLVDQKDDAASLSVGFIMSDEFVNKNYDDDKYIQVLYNTFFCREADEAGKAYWMSLLQSGRTRGSVLAGFVNSQEFFYLCSSYGISRGVLREDGSAINMGIYKFSERLYSQILERDGDMGGIEFWANQIDTKACQPQDAAIDFFWSEEYLSKNTTDEKYICQLYRTFMGREADEGGLTYWKNTMNSGTDRMTVLQGFAYSDEFKEIMQGYGL